MTTSRSRLLLLAVGLLTAGPASAATLTVYAKMSGTGASGPNATSIGRVAPVSGNTNINCFTNATAGCIDTAASGAIVLAATDELNAAFLSWGAGCRAFPAWSATVTYALGEIVTAAGVRYSSAVADNLNNPVTDPAFWTPIPAANCYLDLASNRTVTANFAPATQSLSVKTYPPITDAAKLPAYRGVLDAPTTPAISCQTGSALLPAADRKIACSATVPAGTTSVVITASPVSGSKVASWSGCASTTPAVGSTKATCTVAMNNAKLVSATFGPINVPVTARVNGPGRMATPVVTNIVTDAISCGGTATDCTGQVVPGQSVTLAATADAGAMFVGWTGCSSATTTCTLSNVTAPVTVTATFKSNSCNSCHGTPPGGAHAAFSGDCATCHDGYTNNSYNPAVHMDGTVQIPATNGDVSPPAGYGFNLEVVGFQPFGDATYATGYVDLKATDNATPANALDLVALINGCETNSGPLTVFPCDGSARTPRISIGQIQADGSFKPALRGSSATTVASSETIATSRMTAMGAGVYRYQLQYGFLTAVAYDPAKDYRAVAYGGRYFKAAGQSSVPFYSTDYADLQGTGTVRAKETVTDAACNACHGQLTLHGMRRGVNVCLSCHNPNLALGSGNKDTFKWDLKNLVHKLHSGKNYGTKNADGTFTAPTRPDGLTGTSTPVATSAWGTTMDASHMAMGPSHSTYMDGGFDPGIMGAECGTCHTGANAAFAYTKPSRLACGSCHDAINFATGVGHVVGGVDFAQADDSACAGCHPEATVRLQHSPFYDTANNESFLAFSDFPDAGHKLFVKLVNVTVDANGRPTFTLDAQYLTGDGAGALTAAPLNTWAANADSDGVIKLPTCAFTLAGPNSDYTTPATGGTTLGCTAQLATTGSATVLLTPVSGAAAGWQRFTITQPDQTCTKDDATKTPPVVGECKATTAIFAGKTGAWTLSFEIMANRSAQIGTGTTYVRKPFSADPNFLTLKNNAGTWAVSERTGAGADDRRAVVSYDKCNACHVDLGFHSNRGRQGPDYCAVCHNPKLDNAGRSRAPASAAYTTVATGADLVYLPESVSMNVFIHRIHMGDELPSVQDAAMASPWVPEPGKIIYGATRSNFVGVDAATPPEMADLSNFAMPNPMGRCDQCHIGTTFALPTTTGLAPVERSFKKCNPVTVSWDTAQWCDAASTNSSGMPFWDADLATSGVQKLTVITPPIKASCTSCHDDLATDAHVDGNTVNPMTRTANESACANCHGAASPWDVLRVHPTIP